MKVLAPIEVTDAILTATNVLEDDAPEWDGGATYALGARVILAAENKLYESAQPGNSAMDPTAEPTWWLEVGATKPWRAFDGVLSAPISQAGTITYMIEPTELTRAVALVGVVALEATVEVKNSGGTVLVSRTQNLADYSEMVDALAMVTIAPGRREVAIFEDVICQPGNKIEITIGDGSGVAEVSEVIIGDTLDVGITLVGAGIGIHDFSKFDEDQFGNVSITQRGYRDTTTFPVSVKTGDVGRLRRRLAGIRARLALYYFTAQGVDYGTTVFGRYEALEMLISGPNNSDLELRIEGTTYNGN